MAGIELWWLGQSSFRLREPSGSLTAYVDPFLSEHEGRTWPAPIGPDALASADVVLCTHEHIDHFDQPALRAANQVPGARFKLVVPQPIVDKARALGIPQERIYGAQPGHTLEMGSLRVHPVPACHGINVSDAYSFGKQLSGGLVRYLGYVMELGSVSVYHAGDTTPYDGQAELVRKHAPQVALLPINGRGFYREHDRNIVGNCEPREAAHLAHDIGAQVLIPMHWDLFPFNPGYPRDLVGYANDHLPALTVMVLGRSARFVYAPADRAA